MLSTVLVIPLLTSGLFYLVWQTISSFLIEGLLLENPLAFLFMTTITATSLFLSYQGWRSLRWQKKQRQKTPFPYPNQRKSPSTNGKEVEIALSEDEKKRALEVACRVVKMRE